MNHSFAYIEQILNSQKNRQQDFPHQEIVLIRLCIHTFSMLLEFRNKLFKQHNINDTLFMALVVLKSQEKQSIQPSELSKALNSSKTNATRVADELEQRGWIERQLNQSDRRSHILVLTSEGKRFLNKILPTQHEQLRQLWSTLSLTEQEQLEATLYKLLHRLEQIDTPNSASS
jgi:MarR family transcriptional repressor of emrRAB